MTLACFSQVFASASTSAEVPVLCLHWHVCFEVGCGGGKHLPDASTWCEGAVRLPCGFDGAAVTANAFAECFPAGTHGAAVMGGVEGPCSSVAAVRQQPVPAQRVCCGCLAQAPCNLSSSLGVHINCLCGLHTPARPHRCLKLFIVLQLNFDVNASQVCVSTAAQMTSDMPVAQPQCPAAVQVYPVC